MFRRRRPEPQPLDVVQPASLAPRWAQPVQAALAARARYQDIVGTLPEGPLRERVQQLGARVDAGVLATWEAACRAAQQEAVVAAIDVTDAIEDYKAAKRELEAARRAGHVPQGVEERTKALEARHTAANRLANALDDTATQLTVLEARLEAALARAAEVALRPEAADDLGADLDAVVGELGALRQALDGLDRPPG